MLDAKGRRYLVALSKGGAFHSHNGVTSHDLVIGSPEGSTVRSTSGARYVAVRPTLSDVVLKMPRGAQVVYPKDLGAILIQGDIFAGARVLEAGVGSGALSMAMLRAGARVTGYEIREDFAAKALSNVRTFLNETLPDLEPDSEPDPAPCPEGAARGQVPGPVDDHFQVECRDIYDGIGDNGWDRVILDLPEPWRVVAHAQEAMAPGGIFLAYLPTINQTAQLRAELDISRFGMAQTLEVLHRTWHIEGRSVRPDHRMVGHTGFLTHARLLVVEPDLDRGP